MSVMLEHYSIIWTVTDVMLEHYSIIWTVTDVCDVGALQHHMDCD